jgi:hypothetical protein
MKVHENKPINFKNIIERTELNNIELENDSLCNNSYKNSSSFFSNIANLQSLNTIEDNNSFKNDLNNFNSPKQTSAYYDNKIFDIKKVKKKGESKIIEINLVSTISTSEIILLDYLKFI